MSEKINLNTEQSSSHETLGGQTEHKTEQHNKRENLDHTQVKHEHKDKIDEILTKIEKSAKSSDELSGKHNSKREKKDDYHSVHIGSQLRSQGLKQSLKVIQRRLPRHQKAFSKFVHNSAVEKISDASAATVARPSGLLAAGVTSFVASIGVLTVCRYFGYEYNYLIGLLSLVGGFLAGIILEGLLKIIKSAPR